MSEEIDNQLRELVSRLVDIELEESVLSGDSTAASWRIDYYRTSLNDAKREKDEVKISLARDQFLSARIAYNTTLWRLLEVRKEKRGIEIEIEELFEEKEQLEEELSKLEFVDIDEETGYLIVWDAKENGYWLVHPDDFKNNDYRRAKFYKSVEVVVNFTIDTKVDPKYEEGNTKRLQAEIRLSVNVRGTDAHDMARVLKDTFKAYVTDKFEHNWKVHRYKIASGVMDTPSDENRVRRERAEQTGDKEILERVKKVGALFRVNDDATTVVTEVEHAEAKVEGEWSSSEINKEGFKTRDYTEPFDDFDLEEYLDRRLEWSKVRREYKGKTGWEILKRD